MTVAEPIELHPISRQGRFLATYCRTPSVWALELPTVRPKRGTNVAKYDPEAMACESGTNLPPKRKQRSSTSSVGATIRVWKSARGTPTVPFARLKNIGVVAAELCERVKRRRKNQPRHDDHEPFIAWLTSTLLEALRGDPS